MYAQQTNISYIGARTAAAESKTLVLQSEKSHSVMVKQPWLLAAGRVRGFRPTALTR